MNYSSILEQVSAGLSRQLLHNKASVRLNLQDIFLTQVIRGDIIYGNVREHFVQGRDSRVVNISFTCRFGKSSKEPARRNNGSADEEKNRVRL